MPNLFTQLKDLLQQPLPGWEGQKLLSSVGYDIHRQAKPDSKKAAVLLLLYYNKQQQLQLIYIKRPSNNPHDKHGGQISFPGGGVEPEDTSLADTALRETFEEIGVPIADIQLLGRLTDIYVFVSDFLVAPYVAFIEHVPTFIPEASEVDRVITWPLAELIAATVQTKTLNIQNRELKDVPFYNLAGETLWGATAMITSEFIEIIRNNNLHVG